MVVSRFNNALVAGVGVNLNPNPGTSQRPDRTRPHQCWRHYRSLSTDHTNTHHKHVVLSDLLIDARTAWRRCQTHTEFSELRRKLQWI